MKVLWYTRFKLYYSTASSMNTPHSIAHCMMCHQMMATLPSTTLVESPTIPASAIKISATK